jgi:hypothetical protein
MTDATHEKLEIGGIGAGCHCALLVVKFTKVADSLQTDLGADLISFCRERYEKMKLI